jgi:hypothetical protein
LLLPQASEADRRARLVNLVVDAVLRVQWLDNAWPGLAMHTLGADRPLR